MQAKSANTTSIVGNVLMTYNPSVKQKPKGQAPYSFWLRKANRYRCALKVARLKRLETLPKSKKRKPKQKHPPLQSRVQQTSRPQAMTERLRSYVEKTDFSAIRQKPRALSVLFCDYANRTDDNKVNLIGIFDRIYAHQHKMSPPFILYARTAETFEDNLWVRIVDPDNQPIAELRFDPPTIPKDPDRGLDWPNQLQFFLPIRFGIT